MKKLILSLCAALPLALPALAGEVAPGSVPGTLNYQGRLERDNAPITGPVHLYFRVYNSPTAVNTGACGAVAQPCLWESPEITAQATQGIFSADLTPPAAVLSGGERLYLEVQVESDTLSPREPLNSVAYAVVARHLEDGASVRFSSFTATYAALVSTAPGAYMTVGTDTPYPTSRLTVAGDITLSNGGRIRFPDGSLLIDGFTGTNSGALVSASNVTIEAGTGILFGIPTVAAGEKARITSAGDLGVGTNAPMGKLDVNGSLFVGNEGISDRADTEVNIAEDLVVDGGRVRGIGNNYITLGETPNTIIAATNNTPRLWLNASGFLGVGTNAPAVRIHSANDIAADDGVRGGQVSIGDYSTWTTLDNEIRSEAGSHLLLQQTNPFNVGIGTDTPREKLHVRGSVLSDYGVIAATAAFSGNVRVDGDLDANSSDGNMVYLSSTVVYGSLQVTGGIGSMAGIPAYIASSNTFTGQNTFVNQVAVSSDVIVNSRLGVGAIGFDFPGDDYLQVGGNTSEFAHNAAAYLVAGSTGEARVAFYRGPVQAASLETLSGNYLPNLALVVGGQAKTVTDSVYHRIQNSVVWISTGYNTTPSIFVSSTIGNVGVGTSVMDPNWKLTVDGNIRISRTGGGLLFPDGTSITTGNLGALSVGNVSNNSDAVIQSNADLSGGGNVILRAGSLDGLILNTGGNVGVGTINPVSRLNVRGGDLVLGNPLNPYGADSVEDLVVAGNIAFDGELLQRSSLQVRLSGLMVGSDVYLSTGPTARTGIGTITPQTKLEVNGDAQFGSGLTKSTFTAAGALQLASPLGLAYGGAGASLTGVGTGGIIYKNAATTLGGSAALTGMVKGNNTGAPTAITGTAGYNTYWSANDTIAAEQYTALSRGGSNADLSGAAQGGLIYKGAAALAASTALTGVIKGNGTSAPTAMTGTTDAIAYWSDANTLNDSAILAHNGVRLLVSAAADFTGSVTSASSGTFRASGLNQYSILTSSGIMMSAGRLVMPDGAASNYILASDANGVSRWVNPASGSFGDGWVGNEITDAANTTLTRSGLGTVVSPYEIAINLGNANTWTQTQAFSRGVSVATVTVTSFGSAGIVKNSAAGILSGGNLVALGTDTSGTYDSTADTIADDGSIALGTETSGTYDSTADTIADDGSISLTAEVGGILPAANGGTNNAFTQFSGPATAAKTFTLPNANATILTDNSDVTVAQGGTGVGSLTSNAVLLGGASVGSVGPGAANTVLRGTGGAPTFGTIDSNYTTGTSTSFEVYSSTGATGTCRTLTITNGMVTGISGTPHACPAP